MFSLMGGRVGEVGGGAYEEYASSKSAFAVEDQTISHKPRSKELTETLVPKKYEDHQRYIHRNSPRRLAPSVYLG